MNKRIRAWLLCVLMIGSLLMMCACKSDEPDPSESTGAAPSGEVAYKVTLVDGVGTPYTEKLIVKFLQGQEQVAMMPIGQDGSVEKSLPAGEYIIEVSSTDTSVKYYFDTAAAKVTAEQPELELLVAMEQGDRSELISAPSSATSEYAEFEAVYLDKGTTHVKVDPSDRNYFLMVPQGPGKFEISVVGGGATLGIYGGTTHFVMEHSTVEMVDGKLSTSVQPSMIGTSETGTTVYVLGIDVTEGVTEALVNVIRVGDPDWSFAEEPWSDYQPTVEVKSFELAEGVELKEFDLTAPSTTYPLVYDEAAGQYRVGTLEGPLVYVQLGKPMNDVCLMTMVGEIVYQDGVLMQTGSAPFRYSYNNGQEDFFKEDYTDALREYVTARDKASGVYPLNKDLYYMIPMGIKANGWCDESTANFLFRDIEGFNAEIGWMFLLLHEDLPIPTVEPTDPTEPPTDPTEEVTDPTDVSTGPTDPTTEPPIVQATRPTQPAETTKPTEPAACSHQYSDATCTTGKVCKLCGETSGTGSGHDFSAKGRCKTCGGMVVEDNKSEPTLIASTLEFDVDIKPGHLQYFEIMRVSGTTLKVKGHNAFVVYNKKIYKPEDGVVRVYDLQSGDINTPVELAIGNNGPEDLKTEVTMSYPSGTVMNPKTLKLSQFTTSISAGNDQGVYYSFKASSSGTLTLKIDSVSGSADVGISLFNESTSEYVSVDTTQGDTVSISASKGQVIQIIISTLPDSNFKYPAATVTSTASYN